MDTHIFRVRVRGRFADLREADRQVLLAEHDPFALPRFTESAELTHDGRPDFFTYRLQLRQRAESEDRAVDEVEQAARRLALADLAARGLAIRDMTVTARPMADAWR